MVVILLIIIACCMLFGADKTKEGMSSCLSVILFIFFIAYIMASCGN